MYNICKMGRDVCIYILYIDEFEYFKKWTCIYNIICIPYVVSSRFSCKNTHTRVHLYVNRTSDGQRLVMRTPVVYSVAYIVIGIKIEIIKKRMLHLCFLSPQLITTLHVAIYLRTILYFKDVHYNGHDD